MAQGICSVAGAYTGGSVRIADWTRFAETRHASTPGMLTAMPLTMTIGALIGVLVTSGTLQMYGRLMWNLLLMLQYVQSIQYTAACRAGTCFTGCGFLISQVLVNMTQNAVSSGMDLAGVLPRFITLRRGGLIMCFPGIIIQLWRFLTQASTFVTVISSFGVFVAPMTGILITDYWLIQRHKLIIPDLYREDGIYWYNFGLNWKAFLVFFVVVAPSMPGFIVAVNGDSIAEGWSRVFKLTYFIGYLASISIYFTLSKLLPPKGLGMQQDMPEHMQVEEGIEVHSDSVSNELSQAERGEKEIAELKAMDAGVAIR